MLECALELLVHVVVIHSHEKGVDHNAERDEELHERVEDNESDQLLDSDPTPATVPYAQYIYTLEATGDKTFFK